MIFSFPLQKHRCKQRLTKIRQMLLRQRKAVLSGKHDALVGVKQKTERREAVRESKAEKAAQVELAIERELLERLKQGVYGDLYNFDRDTFEKMLDEGEKEKDDENMENDPDMVDELEELELEEDERNMEYVAADEDGLAELMENGEAELSDLSDISDADWDETEGGKKSSKDIEDVMGKKNLLKRKKKTRKIEYEYETEEGGKEKLLA